MVRATTETWRTVHSSGTFISDTDDVWRILRNLRKSRWFPILVATVVELVTGTFAMAIAPGNSPDAGLSGAVFGGVTAAALTDREMDEEILHAAAADVLSSFLVFAFFVGSIVSTTSDLVTAILGTLYLVMWGSVIAIPIGLVSLGIAAISAVVTSLAKRVVRKYR